MNEDMVANLGAVEQRIPPARAIVPLRNRNGKPYSTLDLKRWLRLNRIVFKTEKADLLAWRCEDLLVAAELLTYAQSLHLKVSLRLDATFPPALPGAFDSLPGLHDVFLCPRTLPMRYFEEWLDACKGAAVPVRIQVQAPFGPDLNPAAFAGRCSDAGVVVVNVALFDPFAARPPCRNKARPETTVAQMNALIRAFDAFKVEANLFGLPFCLVTEENIAHAENSRQFFMDHQQYEKRSYDLALALYRRSPALAGKAVLMYLARYTAFDNPIDRRLLPWLLYESPRLNLLAGVFRKLTRHLRIFPSAPKPLENTKEGFNRAFQRFEKRAGRSMGPVCSDCCMRRICDHKTPGFKRILPGLSVLPQPGDVIAYPLHFARTQPKYYDAVDQDRRDVGETYRKLAEEAKVWVANRTPDREIDSASYGVESSYWERMPGGVKWFSYTHSEKRSSPLAGLYPPFALSATFGGGIADYVGFSLGRHCKILCPMEAYTHRIVLYCDREGRYVLLRDGDPVRPAQFEGGNYVPLRLGGYLEPRISIWNIDHHIVTQTILLWEGERQRATDLATVRYSILIVCTRYARRLETVLGCIAHQQGIDRSKIEVIIAYVPGIDATDDVIDSAQLVYPDLRILRAPYPEDRATSKGFMINESLRMASGEWIVFLDADTLIPPDFLARIDEISDNAHFIAPDGRRMLTRETTAKILMGEIQPWAQWDELIHGAGEFRLREAWGVPIGFCQCVRKSCLDQVAYEELEHFEGADWRFGVAVRARFGIETRLGGVPVLHLDHGGSQWYGTQKQL